MTSVSERKLTPPRGYLAVIRTIDRFTELTGYLFVIPIVPLILANVVEVASGAPTRSDALGHQEFVLNYKTYEALGPACLPV